MQLTATPKLLYVLALLILLAASTAAIAMQQETVEFNIAESSLKIIVYDDGAVQPVYKLRASIILPEDSKLTGEIAGHYTSSITSNSYETRLTVSGVLHSIKETGAEPSHIAVELSGETSATSFSLRGYIKGSSASGEGEIRIEKLDVKVSDDKKTATIDAVVLITPAKDLAEKDLPSPEEINAALQSQGITYI